MGWVLRVLIEKQDADPDRGSGVNVALCASVSRDLSAALDAEDAIDRKYILEVSSAGLERPLTEPRDFERFAGRSILLTTTQAIDGRRRFKGTLNGADAGTVKMTLADGTTLSIPDKLIKRANLTFEQTGFGLKAGD
jgi:ribosome maturation factor RimP